MNKPIIKKPQPFQPKPLIVKIPGTCSECTPGWGHAAATDPPIPVPPNPPVKEDQS